MTAPSAWTAAASIAADWWDPPHDADRELAQRCATHLPTMLREAWPILEPANPLVTGWHLDVICEHLMAVTDGELLRLIINQPPRTLKSLLVGVVWPAWEWLRAPNIRWMFASYAADLANRDSLKCRRLIESRGGMSEGTLFQRIGYQGVLALLHQSPWTVGPTRYQPADGKPWVLTADQNAKTKYETSATGMRLATSVGGLGTGEGGDRVCIDDPLNAKQARSTAERTAANRWWDDTMVTRFNTPRAAAVIVAQRLHEDDLCGHLLAQGGWHHLCLPAEYEPASRYLYPARVVLPALTYNVQAADGAVETVVTDGGRELPGDPRTEPGELLEPVRLSREALDVFRPNSYMFAGQFQQQPAPEEGGMFKRAWWARRWQPGFDRYLDLGWDRVIQSWDMHFGVFASKSASASYVVGQVWGFHGADCYLLAQVRGRFSFADTCHVLRALTAFEPRAAAKLVEDKANGPAVVKVLKSEVGGLIEFTPKGTKEARAAAVSPLAEAGNVILPAADTIPCPAGYEDADGVWHDLTPTTVADWIHEHSLFPAGTHDDQVDAHSQALTWANPMPRHEPVPEGLPRAKAIMSGVLGMKS